MARINGNILTIAAALILIFILFIAPGMMKKTTKSSYEGMNLLFPTPMYEKTHMAGRSNGHEIEEVSTEPVQDFEASNGVSTSLLPREIPSAEDFGAFSPEAIMEGQNYLDPRAQIGYPETLGGVLRNQNYDIRSEPPNPRVPVSIFNNSTIVPDLMRPQFEIGR